MKKALLVLVLAGCSNNPATMQQPGDDAQAGTDSTTNPPKDSGNPNVDSGWKCDPPAAPGSFYEFTRRNLQDTRDVSMCEFRGYVVLVVNVASYCGYTYQYEGLETTFEKYKAQKFTVLGFPCNQFGMQEPGDAANILEFCEKTYKVAFPMFQKIDVNGPNTDPLYVWLKAQPGGAGNITWNFNKFLLGRDGKLIKRYPETTEPSAIAPDIEAALAK